MGPKALNAEYAIPDFRKHLLFIIVVIPFRLPYSRVSQSTKAVRGFDKTRTRKKVIINAK